MKCSNKKVLQGQAREDGGEVKGNRKEGKGGGEGEPWADCDVTNRLFFAARLGALETHQIEMQPRINFIERGRLFRRELKRRRVRFLPMQVLRRIFEKAGV